MSAREGRAAAIFVAPAAILMLLILIVPVGIAAVLSFTDYSLGNAGFSWVGLENYEDLWERRNYRRMLVATATYVLTVVPLSVGLGLGAALLIHKVGRIGDLYKTLYFLPVMAALLATALVWEFMLHPTVGLVNDTLSQGCGTWIQGLADFDWLPWVESPGWYSVGCDKGFPLWFGDKSTAIWVLCFIGVWQGFGFNMVLYLAGLTGIPRELYQAAAVDGAHGAWERFRLVTWPMLGPTTVFVVTISTIRSFQVFDTVEAITGGGPSKTTYVMMFAIYEKAVQHNLIGVGAAITMLFLVFVMLLTLIQRTLIERRVHYA